MGDNKSLEPFFNDDASDEASETGKRDLRFKNVLNPIDGYQLSESEVNSGSSATNFYGFENKDGLYYITKQVRNGVLTTYTFSSGTSGFATAWTNRVTETYKTFANEF